MAVLRVLDLQERSIVGRGERQQVDHDAVRKLVRVARSVLGSGDARLAADRVEHVGGQHHVQHLLDDHRADHQLRLVVALPGGSSRARRGTAGSSRARA